MCGPPEPLIEVFLCPCGIAVVPESAECLLEQIGPVDLEVQLFQIVQPDSLLIGKIPGVFQPDVARLFE